MNPLDVHPAVSDPSSDPLEGKADAKSEEGRGRVVSVVYSPDGRTVASAHRDGTILFWDTATRAPTGDALVAHGNRMGHVNSVAYSPDGRILASASRDSTVRFWNTTTRQLVGEPLTGHKGDVFAAVFSPDGTRLATAAKDGTLRLWRVAWAARPPLPSSASEGGFSAECVRVLQGHTGPVQAAAFSPDGRLLASVSEDGTVRLWNGETGQPPPQSPPRAGERQKAVLGDYTDPAWKRPGSHHSVAFSPDGRILASTSHRHCIRLWDVVEHKPLGEPLEGHGDFVLQTAFSPDGKLLASVGWNGDLRLWDIESVQPRGMPTQAWACHPQIGEPLTGHVGPAYSVAFSPDGRTLVTSGWDGTVRFWDVAERRQYPFTGISHAHVLLSVAFSPDGKLLATSRRNGVIRLWDLAGCHAHACVGMPLEPPMVGHENGVLSVVFSPDGRVLASAGFDHTVRRWDVATRRPIGPPMRGHTDEVIQVEFSPDGKLIASGSRDMSVRLWDAATGEPVGEAMTGHTYHVRSVSFSPDGTTLASGSKDMSIRLWDVATGRQIGEPITGHTNWLRWIDFSPDGRLLASASNDGTIRLWRVGWHARNEVTGVAEKHALPDGQGVPPAKARAAPAECIAVLEGHTDHTRGVEFSPDGRLLASSSLDRTIRLWDVETGKPVGEPLVGHTAKLTQVTFSPDGRMLASGSDDGTVRLWDVATGKQIGEPLIEDEIRELIATPGGMLSRETSEHATATSREQGRAPGGGGGGGRGGGGRGGGRGGGGGRQ